MTDLQPVADGGDGGDGAWPPPDDDQAASFPVSLSAQSNAAPGAGGYPLDSNSYPGWTVGDFTSGQGLLGVCSPAPDRTAAQNAAATVKALVNKGIAQRLSAAPVASSSGFFQGVVSGAKDQISSIFDEGQAWHQHPLSAALAEIPKAVALSNPANSFATNAENSARNFYTGLDQAAHAGAVPNFLGRQLGALGVQLAPSLLAGRLGWVGDAALPDGAITIDPPAPAGPLQIPRIATRLPINSGFAGQIHPSGIGFTEQGFPDFGPQTKAQIQSDALTGVYGHDEALANAAAGYDKTPPGYVWHHVEDGKTMQLVSKSIHQAVRHTGGAAVIRNGGFDQ